MDQIEKEKLKLTTREMLLYFCDVFAKLHEIAGYPWQKKEAQKYFNWREIDKDNFYQKLWKLEKQGYIKRFKKEKRNLIELTPIGKEKAIKYQLNDFRVVIPKEWDKKWRIVIFDIPEEKKVARNILRGKLKKIGFLQLQKSVFVFPYDCLEVIKSIKFIYCLGKHIQYIVAESIETEIDLVDYFYSQGIIIK